MRGSRHGNWGLVLAAIIGAGVSIYAVADPEMRASSFATDVSTKSEAVCAENLDETMVEVAAFDPFLTETKTPEPQEVAELSEPEMDDVLAVAKVPDPTLLSEEIGMEPTRAPAPRQTTPQLAASTGQRTPPGRPKRPGNRGKSPWGKGGKYSWVLPTAAIAGGVTGITLGTVAIVRNNNKSSSKKNPPLTQ
jgi:hypothetical protein